MRRRRTQGRLDGGGSIRWLQAPGLTCCLGSRGSARLSSPPLPLLLSPHGPDSAAALQPSTLPKEERDRVMVKCERRRKDRRRSGRRPRSEVKVLRRTKGQKRQKMKRPSISVSSVLHCFNGHLYLCSPSTRTPAPCPGRHAARGTFLRRTWNKAVCSVLLPSPSAVQDGE